MVAQFSDFDQAFSLLFTLAPQSVIIAENASYIFGYGKDRANLLILAIDPAALAGFDGVASEQRGQHLLVCPTNAQNAAELRARFAWLNPSPLGLQTSAGLGDRLGLATPGHVRAIRAVGGQIAPIFAQQSIREMTRTVRTPSQVMDDALWGVFAEGWSHGFGADADHLKTPADIDACTAAGFTFFTVDPGQYVNDQVETMTPSALQAACADLPWSELEDTQAAATKRYLNQPFDYGSGQIVFDLPTLCKTAAKYGRVVAHVTKMYRHLANSMGNKPFELEISVDETESPTTHADHIYIVTELRRLGVQWVSLAPRYIGRFEKGVDYIGDLDAFEKDFAIHAAIARAYGPYKLSLHSGSDKFSIYPIAMRQTHGLVHLKTAGTSYLEALRTIAAVDPALFREIYRFSREHYETDRATYHVSAQLDRAPEVASLADGDLPTLLDQFDAREILHVTFGSVLNWQNDDKTFLFKDRFFALLHANPEAYAERIEAHFIRHLRPFAIKS